MYRFAPYGLPPICPSIDQDWLLKYFVEETEKGSYYAKGLLELTPCDLWPYIRGKTVWLIGDSIMQVSRLPKTTNTRPPARAALMKFNCPLRTDRVRMMEVHALKWRAEQSMVCWNVKAGHQSFHLTAARVVMFAEPTYVSVHLQGRRRSSGPSRCTGFYPAFGLRHGICRAWLTECITRAVP